MAVPVTGYLSGYAFLWLFTALLFFLPHLLQLDIQDLDLGNLDENDFSSFAIYENEGLTFSIANQDMVPVYTSKKPSEFYVNRNIATKLDAFSKTPDIIHRSTKLQEATKLRGIITQKGISYYIVIKDASLRDSGGNITAQFLLGTIV